MLKDADIAVVGGGVAGFAAARAVALRGARVTLFDPGDGAAAGGGLQIAPNGVRVLDALGLGAQARAQAVANRAVVLIDGLWGKRITRLDLGAHAGEGLDYLLFHRADLVGMLAEGARAAGVAVRTGARIASVTEDAEGVTVTTATGGQVRAGLALGADGIHSIVRPMLNGAEAPFFTGQVAWRALIPAEAPEPEVRAFLGPGAHLVTYPLRDGSVRNLVAVEERRAWAAEGWDHPDDPAHLREAFAGFCDEVTGLLTQVRAVRLWGLFRHPVAARWHGGRIAILGDAAHPTLPFMAQGANMALEDAWVLAAMLDRHPLAEALARYQAVRAPRVSRAIAAANANARNYHLRGLTRYGAHKLLRVGGLVAPRLALSRFDWLYRHDVTRE